MTAVNPYLNFPGTTEEAFNFYKSIFGGEFAMLQRFKDTPEKDRVPAHEQEKIMHIALPIGKGVILMAMLWSFIKINDNNYRSTNFNIFST